MASMRLAFMRIQLVEIATMTFVLPYDQVRKKTDYLSPGRSVLLPKRVVGGRRVDEDAKRMPHCDAEEGRREARDVEYHKLELYQDVQGTQAEDRAATGPAGFLPIPAVRERLAILILRRASDGIIHPGGGKR